MLSAALLCFALLQTNASTAAPGASGARRSVFELLLLGGPLMIPIAVCSVIALATVVERWIGLGARRLGSRRYVESLRQAAATGGASAALALCRDPAPLIGRILSVGLTQSSAPAAERDRLVGDVASTELKRLLGSLRTLQIVWLIAPLLGLLGTVWGMIEAFGRIAGDASLGRPDQLADGIYQALVTTAAGLSVAIPAIVCFHLLKGRIEGFARRVEDAHRTLEVALGGRVEAAARGA
jgi:biopolymer transport protein ExbB